MNYTAALITNTKNSLNELNSILNTSFPELRIIGKTAFLEDVLGLIRLNQLDLLFVMDQINGIDVVDVLKRVGVSEEVQIVFLTKSAFVSIAICDLNIVGVINYPFIESEIKDKMRKILGNVAKNKLLNVMSSSLEKQFSIPQSKRFQLVSIDQIEYCQASGAYTHFFVSGGVKLIATKPLKEMCRRLPSVRFLRIHQSFLVRIGAILEFDSSLSHLRLFNDKTLPVSRGYKKQVKAFFENGEYA